MKQAIQESVGTANTYIDHSRFGDFLRTFLAEETVNKLAFWGHLMTLFLSIIVLVIFVAQLTCEWLNGRSL